MDLSCVSFDDLMSRLVFLGPGGAGAPAWKILVEGEGAGPAASSLAGWMAAREMEPVILDGANRFDPYAVSALARNLSLPPEGLLRRIRIARAFTCHQMAVLVGEKLPSLIRQGPGGKTFGRRVIVLGPITPFLDEDVPEREVCALFERSLRRVEAMAAEGTPFLLFQPPFPAGSRRGGLARRLIRFSDLVWQIGADADGVRIALKKGPTDLFPPAPGSPFPPLPPEVKRSHLFPPP
jgi:hypothetical protein